MDELDIFNQTSDKENNSSDITTSPLVLDLYKVLNIGNTSQLSESAKLVEEIIASVDLKKKDKGS
jgi:hypothetical protein